MPGMRARAALDALAPDGAHTRCASRPPNGTASAALRAIVTVTPEIAMSHPGTEGAPGQPTPLVAVDAGLTMLFKGFAYGFSLDVAISGPPELNASYAQAEASARKRLEGLWPIWLGIAKENLSAALDICRPCAPLSGCSFSNCVESPGAEAERNESLTSDRNAGIRSSHRRR